MTNIISKLYNSSLREMIDYIRDRIQSPKPISVSNDESKAISRELHKQFEFYKTSNLKSKSIEEFSRHIKSKIGIIDPISEGYSEDELERQRDLSVKFHWGHNHDFGEFKLEGSMGDRHIDLLTNFIAHFPLSLDDVKGKEVFDIGCWTGGTTLLLASLKNRVFAIEEVKKYADMTSYLSESFGIDDTVSVKSMSIYNCNSEEFYDRFDVVYFPGVIYHLSDPLLALRILYNSTKKGGIILIESAGINHAKSFCRFDGSLIHHLGTKERLNRVGWNLFMPSPSALLKMMREAGFDEIQTLWDRNTKRVYGYGKKVSQVGICKAGLSVPKIR